MAGICHLFPGHTVHEPGLPGSIWDLPLSSYLVLCHALAVHNKSIEEANRG